MPHDGSGTRAKPLRPVSGVISGLAGPWNRGIIAHQTPHFRRPPKHVNNKGPLVFAQTFCTACFISLENLHIYSKTYVFSNTFEGFRPKCTFRGCLSKYRRTFIVYMFRRPPEVWSLMSDNALISGTGKIRKMYQESHRKGCWTTCSIYQTKLLWQCIPLLLMYTMAIQISLTRGPLLILK